MNAGQKKWRKIDRPMFFLAQEIMFTVEKCARTQVDDAVRVPIWESLLGNPSGATTHVHQNRDDGFRVDNFSAVHPLQCLR